LQLWFFRKFKIKNSQVKIIFNMKTAIHILILEDVSSDAELIELELRKSDFPYITQRVDTKETFLHALKNWSPDLLLSDYELPGFTGMEAINLVQKHYPHIPVIVVTGSINEETAVQCMKAGAANYVLKDHLLRLNPGIKEALNTKRIKEEKVKAEQTLKEQDAHLQSILDHMLDGVITIDERGKITSFNPAAEKLLRLFLIRGAGTKCEPIDAPTGWRST